MGTPEYEAIIKIYPRILLSIRDNVETIAHSLRSSGILGPQDMHMLTNSAQQSDSKAQKLLDIVMIQVQLNSRVFYTFMEALRNTGIGGPQIAEELEKALQPGAHMRVALKQSMHRDVTHPMDQLDCTPGSQVRFSVSSTTLDPKYQWYFNDNPIDEDNAEYSGSTTNCLVVRRCLSTHEGQYKCVISSKEADSEVNYISSNPAHLKLGGKKIDRDQSQLLGRILEAILQDPNDQSTLGIDIQQLNEGTSDYTYEELEILLKENLTTRALAQNLQSQLSKMANEKKLYEEAVQRDGSVPLLYLKMLAIGPGQVGKTTFLKRLLGHNTNEDQCSTGQAEMEQVYIRYSRETVAVSPTKQWQAVESEKEVEEQSTMLMSLVVKHSKEKRPPLAAPVTQSSKLPLDPKIDDSGRIEESDTVATTSDTEATTPDTVATTFNTEANTSDTVATTFDETVSPTNKAQSTDSDIPPDISATLKAFDTLQNKCYQRRSDSQLEGGDIPETGTILINIADIGGQPAFLEMLPSITIGPAMYLVFMKLLNDLTHPYPVMCKPREGFQAHICEGYTYTAEEVIFTILSSIACFGHSDMEIEEYLYSSNKTTTLADSKIKSLALLLGTFADKVTDEHDEDKIKDTEKKLKEQLESTQSLEEKMIRFSHEPNYQSIIYRINNKPYKHRKEELIHRKEELKRREEELKRREEEMSEQELKRSEEELKCNKEELKCSEEELKHSEEELIKVQRGLLEKLFKNDFGEYKIPIKWMEFSICLKLLAEIKKTSELSLSDCLILGEKLTMSEEMVKAALQFLHKYIGLVLYFPGNEKLQNKIICDPQAVFSSISELIFKVYDTKILDISEAVRLKFIDTGHFSPTDIKHWPREKLLPLNDLIHLMVYLNIAAPSESKGTYFLPAILQSDKTEPHIECEGIPEPLCISFRTGFLPLGFVCALIAKLINMKCFELPKYEKIYKNRVKFLLRGLYDITLISWPKYCEFRVSRADGAREDEDFHNESCCPFIRDTIREAVDCVVDSMSHSSVFQTCTLGFKCPSLKHASTEYGHKPVTILDLKITKNTKCMNCDVCPPVKPSMHAWLAPRITSQPPPDVTVDIGKEVTLSVTATGADLVYQWYKNDKEVSDDEHLLGCNSHSLQVQASSSEQEGNYYCEVSNSFKSEGKQKSNISKVSIQTKLNDGGTKADVRIQEHAIISEAEKLKQCYPKILACLTQAPNEVAVQLKPYGILAEGDQQYMNNPHHDSYEKAQRLLDVVQRQVKGDPQVYYTFIDALKEAGEWTKTAVALLAPIESPTAGATNLSSQRKITKLSTGAETLQAPPYSNESGEVSVTALPSVNQTHTQAEVSPAEPPLSSHKPVNSPTAIVTDLSGQQKTMEPSTTAETLQAPPHFNESEGVSDTALPIVNQKHVRAGVRGFCSKNLVSVLVLIIAVFGLMFFKWPSKDFNMPAHPGSNQDPHDCKQLKRTYGSNLVSTDLSLMELLTIDHVGHIYELTYDARTHWKNIGMMLKVDMNNLASIEMSRTSHNIEDYYREMLKTWISTAQSPVLQDLLNVLESKTIDMTQIAKYVQCLIAEHTSDTV